MPLQRDETTVKFTQAEINYLIEVLEEIRSPIGRSVQDKIWKANNRLYTRRFRPAPKDKTSTFGIPKQQTPVLD